MQKNTVDGFLSVSASVKSCKRRRVQVSMLQTYSRSWHIFTCRVLCAVCPSPFSR